MPSSSSSRARKGGAGREWRHVRSSWSGTSSPPRFRIVTNNRIDPLVSLSGGRKVAGRRAFLARRMEDCPMREQRHFGVAFGIGGKAGIGAVCAVTAMCTVILAGDRRHRASPTISREAFEGKARLREVVGAEEAEPDRRRRTWAGVQRSVVRGVPQPRRHGRGRSARARCRDVDAGRRIGPIARGSHCLSGRAGRPASWVPQPWQRRAAPPRDPAGNAKPAGEDRLDHGRSNARRNQGVAEGKPEHAGALRRRPHRCDSRSRAARS